MRQIMEVKIKMSRPHKMRECVCADVVFAEAKTCE